MCWIHKATDTHSVHVILSSFPLQQWLPQRSLVIIICALPLLFSNILTQQLISLQNTLNTQHTGQQQAAVIYSTVLVTYQWGFFCGFDTAERQRATD